MKSYRLAMDAALYVSIEAETELEARALLTAASADLTIEGIDVDGLPPQLGDPTLYLTEDQVRAADLEDVEDLPEQPASTSKPNSAKEPTRPNTISLRMEIEDASAFDLGAAAFTLSATLPPAPSNELMEEVASRFMAGWQALSAELDPELIESFHRTLAERCQQAKEQGARQVRLTFPLDLGEAPDGSQP